MAAYEPKRPFAESIRPMVHAAFLVCSENRDLARLVRFTLDVGKVEAVEVTRAREAVRHLVRDACHACYVFGDGSEAQRYEDMVVALLTKRLDKEGIDGPYFLGYD